MEWSFVRPMIRSAPGLCAVCLLLNVTPAPAQDEGMPFIRHYTAEEYDAARQNWAVVQDRNGVMYFANQRGVLEYDGIFWRLIQTPNRSTIRSLAVDEHNRIYVGGSGEFGYLTPDSIGNLQFATLVHLVPESHRDFGDVWQSVVTPDGVYFRTRKYLFRWHANTVKAWKSSTAFYAPFYFGGKFYILESRVALMEVDGDSLVTAPKGEKFATIYPYAMLPYDSESILLGAYSGDLFLYNRKSLRPFPPNPSPVLKSGSLYHGTLLPDSAYAFSVLGLGVVIVDREGKTRQVIDESNDLPSKEVNYLYSGSDGALWLAHNEGISRIEYSSGYSVFDERAGIRGTVRSVLRYKGTLYVASSLGFFSLSSQFVRQPGIDAECWSLFSDGRFLLIATGHGVYQYDGRTLRHLSKNQSQTLALARSREDTGTMYAGLIDGAAVLARANGSWHYRGKIPGIHEEVREIIEDDDGLIWLGTRYQGVVRVHRRSPGQSGEYEIERFDTSSGLPAMQSNLPFSTPMGIRFATRNGLYYFDRESSRFKPDSDFSALFPEGNQPISGLRWEGGPTFWVRSSLEEGGTSLIRAGPGGLVRLDNTPFKRVTAFSAKAIYTDGRVIWFGGHDALYRYDPTRYRPLLPGYPAMIRSVSVGKDSALAGGHLFESRQAAPIPFTHNSTRISYSAPVYAGEESPLFSFRLIGFEEEWSAWSKDAQKEFTYLPEGNYRFQVKAMNLYQQESAIASFDFRILPPWYRSSWAYILYCFLFLAVVFGFVRLSVRRTQRKERARAIEQMDRMAEVERARQAERDLLRMKASQDFHDELGHLVTKISLMSELAKRKASSDKNVFDDIRKIEEHTKSLSVGIKDFVWVLDPARDTLYETCMRIKEFGDALFEYTAIDFHVQGIAQEFNEVRLNPDGRRQLLMIFKEAITNSVKYSNCSKVSLGVVSDNGTLSMTLSDNGRGFMVDSRNSGFGLRNMAERAKRLRAEFTLESSPGSGTSIRLLIPLESLLVR